MQKITPHLWFDKEAKEAAELYISLFPDSKITNTNTLHNTPSGDCDVVSFELAGQSFMSISAGPLFWGQYIIRINDFLHLPERKKVKRL